MPLFGYGSAMKRAKLRGLKRNAAIVLGNVGTADDLPLLDAASPSCLGFLGLDSGAHALSHPRILTSCIAYTIACTEKQFNLAIVQYCPDM